MTPTLPVGPAPFSVSWDGGHGVTSSDAGTVTVVDRTTLSMPDVVAPANQPGIARATLTDSDGLPIAGKTIRFLLQVNPSANAAFGPIGTAVTDAGGVASLSVPNNSLSAKQRRIRAVFDGDATYGGSSAEAFAYRRK